MSKLAKGQQPKGSIIERCYDLLIFLHQPHTAIEIGRALGITKYCVYGYLEVVEARFPLMSRKRVVKARGINPLEYWIDYLGWSSGAETGRDMANGVLLHMSKYGFNGEMDG